MPPVPPEQSAEHSAPPPRGPHDHDTRRTDIRALGGKPAQRPPPTTVGPVGRHGDRASSDEPPPTRYLTGPDVRRRYNISDMSLWRWLHDDALAFPRPALVVNGRRYWREDDLLAWERNRAARPEVTASSPHATE
jgi:predicted DNA-binding transcriptional regulator AlpA